MSVGGFLVSGASGSRVGKNHTTVGRIPGGARVEREVTMQTATDHIELALRSPDFTTSVRLATAVDGLVKQRGFKAPAEDEKARGAWARDAGTVMVRIPENDAEHLPDLIAAIESLEVQADIPVRVIINERSLAPSS